MISTGIVVGKDAEFVQTVDDGDRPEFVNVSPYACSIRASRWPAKPRSRLAALSGCRDTGIRSA